MTYHAFDSWSRADLIAWYDRAIIHRLGLCVACGAEAQAIDPTEAQRPCLDCGEDAITGARSVLGLMETLGVRAED
jgi:predicted RNA-binding Zn-ribbon protein involved in translation (DUF1610 family)